MSMELIASLVALYLHVHMSERKIVCEITLAMFNFHLKSISRYQLQNVKSVIKNIDIHLEGR